MPVKFIFFFFSIKMLESKILDLLCFYLNSSLHYSYQLYSIISYLSQSRFTISPFWAPFKLAYLEGRCLSLSPFVKDDNPG